MKGKEKHSYSLEIPREIDDLLHCQVEDILRLISKKGSISVSARCTLRKGFYLYGKNWRKFAKTHKLQDRRALVMTWCGINEVQVKENLKLGKKKKKKTKKEKEKDKPKTTRIKPSPKWQSRNSLNRYTRRKRFAKIEGTQEEKDLPKLKVHKKKTRSLSPTSVQLASLNLKEGMNSIVFTFSTPMLGKQEGVYA